MKRKQTESKELITVDAYAITIRGHLEHHWQEWFEGLTITLTEDGNTILSGPVQDQAALHGIFNKIYNLGLKLISVNPIKSSSSVKEIRS